MKEYTSKKSLKGEGDKMENTEGEIRYRVRQREKREKPPPDFDKRYLIIGDYRQGDGRRAVFPIIFELEKRRYFKFFLLSLILYLPLIFIIFLNIFAMSQLTSAQANVYALLTNESRSNWVIVREIGRFSDGKRLIEISFSFQTPVLDSILLIRRVYVFVKGEA